MYFLFMRRRIVNLEFDKLLKVLINNTNLNAIAEVKYGI